MRLSGAMQTGRRGLTPYSLKEPRYWDLMKREVRDVISINAFRQIELWVGEIITAGKVSGSDRLLRLTVDLGGGGCR